MTTVFPAVSFNCLLVYGMPNLRRRLTPSGPYPIRTCRNLFGTAPDKDNRLAIDKELTKIAEEQTRRWNFDFAKEKPLEGPLAWTPIDPKSVPKAYKIKDLFANNSQQSSSASSSTEVTSEVASSDKTIVPIEATKLGTTTTHIIRPIIKRSVTTRESKINSIKSTRQKRTSTQTKITDYLKTRKRSRPSETKTEEAESPLQPVLKRAKTSS